MNYSIRNINPIIFKTAFFVIVLGLHFGCKNDLDVNSDYKETVTIFGLLDVNQPKQYVKITKAFLTNQQDVRYVAQLEDSVYFSDIDAYLIEMSSGKKIPLIPENVAGKAPGIFINEPNILYTTTEGLNNNTDYQIHVENRKTGNKANAKTDLVGFPAIFAPVSPFDVEYSISRSANSVISLNFIAGSKAALYDVIIDFEYEEFSKFDTFNKTTKKITWKAMDGKNTFEGERVKSSLPVQLFFDLLAAQIPEKQDWVRRAKTFQFTFIGGGEELKNYISVSRPSIGIVQKQTEYTNINNGLGLFSSRNILVSQKLIPSALTNATLAIEPKTARLGF